MRNVILATILSSMVTLGAASAQQAPAVGPPTAVLASGPEEGQRAPDFSLPWATKDGVGIGPLWSLSGQRGKVVVLAFYPKDFTSGCTAEMKAFTEQYDQLFGNDVVVVGINADSLETHVRFALSEQMPFSLLSDPDQKVARRYGSAGDGGYNRRTIYVIDRKGNVAYVDLRFGALNPQSYQDLKAAVQAARTAG
jgi:peroxiredoxin Q/BCP